MTPEISSPAPKRRKMDVGSNVPKLISYSPFPPNTVSPEWHITAGWHEEPNIALQDEWMRYIWGLYRRGNTTLAGAPRHGFIPRAWTLKQLSNPKAATIFQDAEEQMRPEWTSTHAYDDKSPQFNLSDWADSRRERVWAAILKKVFEIVPDVNQIYEYLKIDRDLGLAYNDGWNPDIYKVDGIRAMIFKDEESMILQDWVAPIDVCHQLQELQIQIWHHRNHLRAGRIVAEAEAPKSAELQAELDKYFGRLNFRSDTYFAGMDYMRAAEEKVWQTPEFAVVVETFRRFDASCHARMAKKWREYRIPRIKNSFRKEELEKLQKSQQESQQLEQLAAAENPEKFHEFDVFWSSWDSKVQKARERREAKAEESRVRNGQGREGR